MKWTQPLNPKQYNLEPLLTNQNRTADWLNTDDADPYSEPNIARWSTVQAAGLVPLRYRAATLERPEIRDWINRLADNARTTQRERHTPVASVTSGPSLLLLGPTGVGKTYQSYGALREMAVTGVVARWTVVTAVDLYARLQPRYGVDSEVEFQRHAKAGVLFIDDLGAGGKLSEHTETVNFRLINYRYDHELPTIITSNVIPRELTARMGDRVASRLTEMCQRLVIEGPDRRRGMAA